MSNSGILDLVSGTKWEKVLWDKEMRQDQQMSSSAYLKIHVRHLRQFKILGISNCSLGRSFRKLSFWVLVYFCNFSLGVMIIKFYVLTSLAFGHYRNVKRAGGW